MRLWHQETSFFQQEMAEALNSTTHNPQWSNQIVEESLDEDSAKAMFEPINGTNLTSATISATTVDNPAYGIAAKTEGFYPLAEHEQQCPDLPHHITHDQWIYT